MNFITSFLKRAPTAESLWREMAVSRTTSEEEQQILEKVKEFVKANPLDIYKFIDGKTHTLLTTSLKYQMKSVAQFLLSQNVDPNFFSNFQDVTYPTDPEKLMPLRLAIQNHWFDVAKTMAKTADTSLSTRTSLLALAIQEGADAGLVQALVEKGTPAELSLLISQEYPANFISQAKAAKLLFNKFKNSLGAETPLHQAAKKASIGMINVFRGSGHPLNPVNGTEGTPLQIATALSHEDTIVALIGAGANPNTPATDGNTPLHVTKDPQIIQYLIENGANPFISNAQGAVAFAQMVEDARKGTHNYDSSFEAIFTALNKELSDVHHSHLIETLEKAAIVLDTFITQEKGVPSFQIQSLVSSMDNLVNNILMHEQFAQIVREVKHTPQTVELQTTLKILGGVAKAENMDRMKIQIALHQKNLAG